MIEGAHAEHDQRIAEAPGGMSAADFGGLSAELATAVRALDELGRAGRARLLRSMSHALNESRQTLIEVAAGETALSSARLASELTRTCYQLELFADVIEEGSYLEATIDHAAATPMGPRPDLRRLLVAIGPVAVFGASNFPFAFSVPGGDTASALAAGCPVVVKVHEGHPETSVKVRQVLASAARDVGLKAPVIFVTFGQAGGLELIRHPAIQGVGFTGSLAAGRLLYDVACARPSPIPFYGELGALNTFTVCRHAAKARGSAIGSGLAQSVTLGVGQFCTKPGIALVPSGHDGEVVVSALVESIAAMESSVMLTERTANNYREKLGVLEQMPGVELLSRAAGHPAAERWGTPVALRATAAAVRGDLLEECFGPSVVVVTYESDRDLAALLDRFGPALTATVHADEADHDVAAILLDQLAGRVGRLVWNSYPTGVAVSWAMQHGGPYPASTSSASTSVGATSIRRWPRPVSFQDVPNTLLPTELRDGHQGTPQPTRRINGVLTTHA